MTICVKHHFLAGIAGLFVLCGAFLGCEREPAPRQVVQLTPEESFEQVAKLFRQSVETGPGGMPGGFFSQDAGGHSRLVVNNKVTHKLVPPSDAGDKYRGIITVTSRYDYSLQKSAEEEKSNEREDEDGNRNEFDSDTMDESDSDAEGIEILDPDLVTVPNAGGQLPDAPSEADLIARRSDEIVTDYELEYKNGRWVLKSSLDSNTERAIENAFNHALELQP